MRPRDGHVTRARDGRGENARRRFSRSNTPPACACSTTRASTFAASNPPSTRSRRPSRPTTSAAPTSRSCMPARTTGPSSTTPTGCCCSSPASNPAPRIGARPCAWRSRSSRTTPTSARAACAARRSTKPRSNAGLPPTLTRLREAEGRVLYVTLSAYLAQSARALYAAHGYENPKQEVDFLSYRELLETLRVPPGHEVSLPAFAAWCERHRQTIRQLGELDAQALFEEFRGVIGAQPGGPLPLADYLALGTRQSLLDATQREVAHGLFQRYRAWLTEAGLVDSNLLAHAWRGIAQAQEPVYDFVVIDEVQDLT